MDSYHSAEVSRYLYEQHGLSWPGDQLENMMKDRLISHWELGPTPNADGTFTRAALDAFADALKRARLTQEGLANAQPTSAR